MAAFYDVNCYKGIIDMYRPLLEEKIVFIQVAPYLTGLIKNERTDRMIRGRGDGIADAVPRLLHYMIEENTPGWFASFTTALQEAGYSYLTDLLRGYTELRDDSFEEGLLDIFLPQLRKNIDCGELVIHLIQSKCLTDEDEEMIKEQQRLRGNTWAAYYMIQVHLASKDKCWFAKFIMCLNSIKQYKFLAEMFDPKFANAKTDEEAMKIINELKWCQGIRSTNRSGSLSSNIQASGNLSSGRQPSAIQPLSDQASSGPPSRRQPSGNQPSGRQPSGRQPSDDQPSGRQPLGRQPSGCQPSGRQPSGRQPSGRQPSGRQPSGRQPLVYQPSGRLPSDDQPTSHQFTALDKVKCQQESSSLSIGDNLKRNVKSTNWLDSPRVRPEKEQQKEKYNIPEPDRQKVLVSKEIRDHLCKPCSQVTDSASNLQKGHCEPVQSAKSQKELSIKKGGAYKEPEYVGDSVHEGNARYEEPEVEKEKTISSLKKEVAKTTTRTSTKCTVCKRVGNIVCCDTCEKRNVCERCQSCRMCRRSNNQAVIQTYPKAPILIPACSVCKLARENIPCSGCSRKVVCQRCQKCSSCQLSNEQNQIQKIRQPGGASAAAKPAKSASTLMAKKPAAAIPKRYQMEKPIAQHELPALKQCSLCKREQEVVPCTVCGRKVVCQRCGICRKCKRS